MFRVVVDFLWIAVLLSILLGLLAMVVPVIGQSGSMISTMVGALGAGQFHARRTGAVASKGFAWQAALAITAVMLVLTVVVVQWMRSSGAFPELAEISMLPTLLALGALGIITLLIVRFFFRLGAKLAAPKA